MACSASIMLKPGTFIQQKNITFPRSTTLDFAHGTAVDRWRASTQSRELGANRVSSIGGAWSAHSGPRSWTAPNSIAGGKPHSLKSSLASYLDQPKTLPAFVHLDKVALRFKCWFKDDLALLTGPDRVIIHKVILTYHLIDDSFTVLEPRQENSGLNRESIMTKMYMYT